MPLAEASGALPAVRPAVEADIDALGTIWFEGWHEAHAHLLPAELTRVRTLASFRERIRAALPTVRTVGEVGSPLALCMVKGDELYQLFVSPIARGTGAAAALIADAEYRLAENGAAIAWLACAIGNDRAARFYEKAGWRNVGVMLNRVETPSGEFAVDVWRFEKPIRTLERSMREHASSDSTTPPTLRDLFNAIAHRDAPESTRLLKQAPSLATETFTTDATRESASNDFFSPISHYAYAGDTALHLAAAAYAVDLARSLIAMGAEPKAKNRRGAQPLHYACDGNPESSHWNPAAQYAVIECLIEAGAETEAVDASGVAPLHRAVRTRCASAVRALLRNGADARHRNGNGSTPLDLASRNTGRGGTGSALARAQQAEIVELLLAHGGSGDTAAS
jgi:GNAT superfamily N-acetyltransferase